MADDDQFKTREQFIVQIAEELKILGAGQVLSVEDHDKIDRALNSIKSTLDRRDMLGGIFLDQIPLEFFVPMSQIYARYLAVPFGFTEQELGVMIVSAKEAEKEILEMTLPGATGQRAQPEYM